VGEISRGQWRGDVKANGGQGRLDGGRRLFNGEYAITRSIVVAVGKWMCGGRSATGVSELPKSNEALPGSQFLTIASHWQRRDRRLVSRVSARLSQSQDFEAWFGCSIDLCSTALAGVRFSK
jgi:hypothetical protein